MSVGIYGTKKLADVTSDEVDVLYAFSPDRESTGELSFKPLYDSISESDLLKMLGADGMYKLRLPSNVFTELGFYSVLIKPKTFRLQITDCSAVVTEDEVGIQISKKGIVIPSSQFRKTNSLVGWSIEYIDKNTGLKVKNSNKIITSSDLVSPATNNNTVNRGAISYVLNPGGNALFLTVSPDEGSLVSGQGGGSIGSAGQDILLTNTYFDPVHIEVEMVEHDVKTLSYALYGNTTRDNSTGILTYFDEEGNIYRQYNLYTRKKDFNQGSVDIRQIRGNINTNQNFNTISEGLNS
jgi:hypothetical protein